ncbi:MAG: type II toxin-antitoxin system HicB family antitoxin [Cyanobium sp.]
MQASMSSQRLKVVVERHADGYVAYPLGIHGVVVGQGDTYEEALEDVRSAIAFHRDAFGPDSLHQDDPVQEDFLAETVLAG